MSHSIVETIKRIVKNVLTERVEIDEDFKLSGVKHRGFKPGEMEDYLDRSAANRRDKGDKFKYPQTHRSNIPVKDENGNLYKGIVAADGKEYDLEVLKKIMTQRPGEVLKSNSKMKHSGGQTFQFFDIGMPALKGLAYDEDAGEFRIIDTCPGAGLCKMYCYAMKGNYIRFGGPSLRLTRMLNFLVNDPDGFEARLKSEVGSKVQKLSKKGAVPIVRWHDSGDYFSPDYLQIAINLAEAYPDIRFYGYTKMGYISRTQLPDNFVMNYSKESKTTVDGEDNSVDFTKHKGSDVIPLKIFDEFVEIRPVLDDKGKPKTKTIKGKKIPVEKMEYKNLKGLKYRIAAEYKEYPLETLISYDEMMDMPEDKSTPLKWNVIVKSGDGDDAAARKDVKNVLLLIH